LPHCSVRFTVRVPTSSHAACTVPPPMAYSTHHSLAPLPWLQVGLHAGVQVAACLIAACGSEVELRGLPHASNTVTSNRLVRISASRNEAEHDAGQRD